MDDAFAGQADRLSPAQRRVVWEWQRTDRFYEQVQAYLRGTLDIDALTPEAHDLLRRQIDDLDAAIVTSELSRPMTVYRGIRNLQRTFGVVRADDLPEFPAPLEGYTAASVVRAVAVAEFTGPAGALLEIEVPGGTPALWVAGIGDQTLRRQGEVLFNDRLRARVTGIGQDGDLVVVSMQVINS